MHFDENGFAMYSGLAVTFDTDDEGVFLGKKESWITVGTGIPRNSYNEDPLINQAPSGTVPVRKKSVNPGEFPWEYLVDNRNKTVYSKADGSAMVVKSIFFDMSNYTLKARPDSYYIWSETQKNWVLTEENAKKRQIDKNIAYRLLEITYATQRIYDLSEETDVNLWGDDIDQAKVALLTEWRKYLVKVKAVDPTASTITWPDRPVE